MKIGILGSSDVGRALGHGFAELGHEVKIGALNPNQKELKGWLAEHSGASAGSFAEAAAFGVLVVLATKWEETDDAIEKAGLKNFSGKVVIDVTNPLDLVGGQPPEQATAKPDSGGERLQRRLPRARLVGVFSAAGEAHMFRPNFEEGQPEMFVCGNDKKAKKKVAGILGDFGWPVVDLGPIEASRYMEPLAMGLVTHGLNRRCSRRFCAKSRCSFVPFCRDTDKPRAKAAGI